MFQQFYEPHPALKGFINNIMIHQVNFDVAQPRLNFSIPPLPEHCLFFYVRDPSNAEDIATKKKETLSSSVTVGPHTSRRLIKPGCNHLMLKVGFQPGGLYRLLGIPMKELLCNDSFDSTDLLGNDIKEVNDRLMHAASFC